MLVGYRIGTARNFGIAGVVAIVVALGEAHGQSALEIVAKTGVDAGLCVRLGTTDGALESQLASEGRLLVHGLALTPGAVAAARKTVAANKLTGVTQIDRWLPGAPLPYPGNAVNLLVADLDQLGASAPTLEALRAVVAPGGATYFKQGSWQAWTKPRPSEMGDWTHFYGDASNTNVSEDQQMGLPSSVQWMAGVRSQGSTPSNGLRFSGSRMAYEWAYRKEKTSWNNLLTLRDAFSGVHLWSRLGSERSRNMALVKTKPFILTDRLYTRNAHTGVPMVAHNIRTGEVERTYDKGVIPDGGATGDCIMADNTLYQTYKEHLKAVDAGTGALKWSFQAGAGKFLEYPTLIPDKGLVVVAQSSKERSIGRHPASNIEIVYALKIADGSKAWQASGPGGYYGQILYEGGNLFLFGKGGISDGDKDSYFVARISPQNGSVIWKKGKSDHTAMGSVGWLQEASAVQGRLQMYAHRVRDLDVASGNEISTQIFSGNLGRCTMTIPTAKYIFNQGVNVVDLASSNPYRFKRIEITRASCGSALYPANGMLYGQPNRCGCAPTLRGYMALASEPLMARLDDGLRLEKGAAAAPDNGGDRKAEEWPVFQASFHREASVAANLVPALKQQFKIQVTRQALSGGPLREDWNATGNHITPLTQPTVAGGKVYVAVPDENAVAAFDAVTGDSLWRYVAGGRVDSPPSLVDGLCVFGSRDGWIYCLNAATGDLVWRHFAAHTQRYIAVASQMESAWPVHGSLVVHKGKVIATAGRHQEADGGILAWILELYSGKSLFTTTISRKRDWYTASNPLGGQKNGSNANSTRIRDDLLSYDGRYAIGTGFVIDPEQNAVYEMDPRSADLSTGMQPKPAAFSTGTHVSFTDVSPLNHSLLEDWGGPGWGTINCWKLDIPGSGFDILAHRIAYSGSQVMTIGPNSLNGKVKNLGKLITYWSRKESMSPDINTWSLTGSDNNVNAALIAGDQVVTSTYAGKTSYQQVGTATLQFYRTADGKPGHSPVHLESAPVENGVASAYGRLYVACENGTLVCLGEKGAVLGIPASLGSRPRPALDWSQGILHVTQARRGDVLVLNDMAGRELQRVGMKEGTNTVRPTHSRGALICRLYQGTALLVQEKLLPM